MTRRERAGLLGILLDLYNRLVSEITDRRVKSYRPNVQSDAGGRLVSQLNSYIEKVPVVVPDKSPKTGPVEAGKVKKIPVSTDTVNEDKTSSATDIPVAQKVQKQLLAEEDSNDIADKLIKSAWEHLHASIRHARTGNSEVAQLHVRIMESALNELAHFLDDKEFDAVVKTLEQEFKQKQEPVA